LYPTNGLVASVGCEEGAELEAVGEEEVVGGELGVEVGCVVVPLTGRHCE
jgi:hypothetical protein